MGKAGFVLAGNSHHRDGRFADSYQSLAVSPDTLVSLMHRELDHPSWADDSRRFFKSYLGRCVQFPESHHRGGADKKLRLRLKEECMQLAEA